MKILGTGFLVLAPARRTHPPPPDVSPLQALVSTVVLKLSALWPCSHPAPPARDGSLACDSSH